MLCNFFLINYENIEHSQNSIHVFKLFYLTQEHTPIWQDVYVFFNNEYLCVPDSATMLGNTHKPDILDLSSFGTR